MATHLSDDRGSRVVSATEASSDLAADRNWARDWLFDAALPLWWTAGADRVNGGWHDKLDQRGASVAGPKRLRVQARQAFVYAQAGRLGWTGPWQQAVSHGLTFMLEAFRRDDGLFRASVTTDGRPQAEQFDLYDQAFVLFALASGYAALGRPDPLRREAEALLNVLEATLRHPDFGFEEASPRRLPLRSNPHMHLLEALLAWSEVGGGSRFEALAGEIVALALDRLIDPITGAIGEFYDGDWTFHPVEGSIREPGHQFEWAHLLFLAQQRLGGDYADAIGRLWSFGHLHGVHDGRAISSVDAAGIAIDRSSRLWAQTERLRTMLTLGPGLPPAEAAVTHAAAAESIATLRRFLDVPMRGLWVDRVDVNGGYLVEPAPASSFYHIVTGLTPLLEQGADPPAITRPSSRSGR